MSETLLPAILALLGVLIGVIVSAEVAYRTSNKNNRTNLYEAVFKARFDVAISLTREAEFLRRGLSEYQKEPSDKQEAFKVRWLGTARELEFNARHYSWVLGKDVETCANALADECRKSMEEQRVIPDDAVESKYTALENAVHEATHIQELDKLFGTSQEPKTRWQQLRQFICSNI